MINNLADFKSYIFRKMGSEIHQIEVTDLQWGDIVEESYKEYIEYSADGSLETIVKLTPTSNIIQCSNNVLNVKGVLGGIVKNTTGITTMFVNSNYAIPISMTDYYTRSTGSGSLIETVLATKRNLQEIRNVYRSELSYDFNTESKRLIIHTENDIDEIIILCDVAEAIELLLNNKYFKMLVLSKCWGQWYVNIAGKYNTEDANIMGNGLKLNAIAMKETSEKLYEEYKQAVEDNELGSFIAPRSLYDINND